MLTGQLKLTSLCVEAIVNIRRAMPSLSRRLCVPSRLYPELPVFLVDDEEAVLSSECKVLMGVGINNLQTCQDPREVIPLLDQR